MSHFMLKENLSFNLHILAHFTSCTPTNFVECLARIQSNVYKKIEIWIGFSYWNYYGLNWNLVQVILNRVCVYIDVCVQTFFV
ncbi:hypothetical protein HanRHA438_Chr04g0183171 [Helianthus annuus]|nr:hypothetical protein HanRHA438_Chr04g0183171 [Helianthus annuus]